MLRNKLNALEDENDIKEILFNSYELIQDPEFWDSSIQEAIYRHYFLLNDIQKVIEFRAFIEKIYDANHDVPVRNKLGKYNPVLLAFNDYERVNYREVLNEIYIHRPDLFLEGHLSKDGVYSRAPIIECLNKKSHLVDIFIENKINWKESKNIYGRDGIGGPKYHFGGNLLTELRSPFGWEKKIFAYLVENGQEKERNISSEIIQITSDEVNLFSEPDYNSLVIKRVNKNTKINPIKITMYKIDNYQWIYLETENGDRGWIPYRHELVYYDTGI
jgi:hypothetical protein